MKPRKFLPSLVIGVTAALMTVLVPDAHAACSAPTGMRSAVDGRALFSAPRLAFGESASAQALPDASPSANHSVVGLWLTEFLLGNGPDRYDQSFQQFHADGMELMISNGLPPALGNVCVGIWKDIGPRRFQVRHMTWNWNPDGTFAGMFLMVVRLHVDQQGNTYSGTWAADSFDLNNQVIPELHAEGIVRSRRITVD